MLFKMEQQRSLHVIDTGMLMRQFRRNTFATNDVGIRRGCGHLEGQAIGSLEGVAVPDEESSWFLVFQNGNR